MDSIFGSPVINRIDKDIRQSVKNMSLREARYLADAYYQMQNDRIREGNRNRQAEKAGESSEAINWLHQQSFSLEKRVGQMLDIWSDNHPVTRWAKRNKGIGPVFSSVLFAYFDIEKAPHAGHLHSYCGLLPVTVWMSAEKFEKELKKILPHVQSELTTSDILIACDAFKRNSRNVMRFFETPINIEEMKDPEDDEDDDEAEELQDQELKYPTKNVATFAKYLSRPPFNPNLKRLCWLMGESFVKIQNSDGPHYGRLLLERKHYETKLNESGGYREIAEQLLAKKKYTRGTVTYKALSQGMLSKGHIHSRSKRWAVKMFLCHFYEVAFYHRYGVKAPQPYAIAYMDHTHRIEPLVSYDFVRQGK